MAESFELCHVRKDYALFCPSFLLRIVAARLNGSLDFFTVEIHKPLGLLQYRGKIDILLSHLRH